MLIDGILSLRRDATPIGDAMTIDPVAFTKDVSVRMAVSALSSLQTHVRRETSAKNHEIVGFMISPQQAVMATSAVRLIEFDCFDKGVRVGAGLEPTTGRGTPVPVYLVQDSESRLLHQLKSDRSLHLFAYYGNLQKLSFLQLSPRYKLHLTPIIPLGLVTNSVAAKLQSTATPRTPASGYLAINRARRAYLLRRKETNLRLAGLWIAGTKDTSPTRAVFDECVAFTLNEIPKATEAWFLLALFPTDSATDYAFYKWHLGRDAFLCHAAEFRLATGKYITSALRALDVLGLTRPYAPPPPVAMSAPETEVEVEVTHEPSSAAAPSTLLHSSASPHPGGTATTATASTATASSPHIAGPAPKSTASIPLHARTVSGTTITTAAADLPATTSTRTATPTAVPATDSVASLHQMVWLLMQQVQHLQEQQLRTAEFHAPPPPPPAPAVATTQSVGVDTSFCSTRSIAINTSFDRTAPSVAVPVAVPPVQVPVHDDAPLSAADLLPDPPRARAPSPARRSHRLRSYSFVSMSTTSFSSESISQILESVTHLDDESLAVDEDAPASEDDGKDLVDERTCQAIASRVVSADDRFILTADDLAALDASSSRRRSGSARRPRSSVSSGSGSDSTASSSMSPLSVQSAGSPPSPSRSLHDPERRDRAPHAAAAVHGHTHRSTITRRARRHRHRESRRWPHRP
ncbi:hypothetical protein AMAG_03038 [Allomyces macrogynus ATCC 38327]|uniref:Uncharacterized protein n=1 Tax=Allomyces macrogynus (strain ATCC 38327) TaxID=578462 RepID=A0A0L0S4L1_ALLM3|nr:hypothetical protein AMAG_03038 [Allomyces macrogynus ATCC 38327]|eukprot:KNE57314.1 hypothetical protein AMAG_03038 [Allomyces macrogynus ATCC 38327]